MKVGRPHHQRAQRSNAWLLSVIALFSLVAVLVACGGGAADPSPTAAALETATFVNPPIVIRLQGDSTQKGYPDVSPASVAQTLLTGFGRNVSLINEGVGTTRTEQRLYGGYVRKWDVTLQPWPEVLETEPAVFDDFKYGINDPRFYPAEVFRANTERLIELSEAKGRWVILESPAPTDHPDPVIQKGIERNVAQLVLIARARPSVTFCNHWGYGRTKGYENQPDGVHPTPYAIQTWIGPHLANCVLIALRKRAEAMGDPTNPDLLGKR